MACFPEMEPRTLASGRRARKLAAADSSHPKRATPWPRRRLRRTGPDVEWRQRKSVFIDPHGRHVVNAVDKKLTGRIAPERIRMMTVPRPPQGVVERFMALGDPSGVVSDAMDELGIPPGVIGASVLRPTLPGTTIVGPALTVRNILQRTNPLDGARTHANKMAEFEAHNLATPGDVLVIQGVANISNMGGISALTGKRQGEAGAVVMGGIRDIAHSRMVGFPLWSSEVSPVTGKWRIETVEINGSVQIGEVRVEPGDLVVADDSGVCFIPRDYILEVLELVEKKAKAEDIRCKAIVGGVAVPEISRSTYGEKE